jgi:hypothetical protein
MTRCIPLALLALLGASAAHAQDTFEIQVYEYATVPAGRWDLETHLNYAIKGTTVPDGDVAPTEHQTHLTFELTRGITSIFELAGYLVLAHRPDSGADFAGWRVRPRIRAPESWNLPVLLSLSLEAGFPEAAYEENSVTLEVRPIIERAFGPVQIDLNPVIGRALKGPGTDEGWDFEPGARLGVTALPWLDLSVEYYGGLGPVTDWLPAEQQVHQFYFGGDLALSDAIVWNMGVGIGLTDAGDQTVLKTRLGWIF